MVTNTPRLKSKQPGSVSDVFGVWPVRAATMADRARASRASCSPRENSHSGRDDILGFGAGFHHAQSFPLLDTVVELAPEAEKILRGGDQGARYHQPEENLRYWLEVRPAGAGDQHRHGTNLQNHFGLAESRGGNRESFGGRDVAQSQNGEL